MKLLAAVLLIAVTGTACASNDTFCQQAGARARLSVYAAAVNNVSKEQWAAWEGNYTCKPGEGQCARKQEFIARLAAAPYNPNLRASLRLFDASAIIIVAHKIERTAIDQCEAEFE